MENHDPVKSSREKTESSFDKLMSSKKAHNFSSLLKGRATDKLTGERLYRVQPGPDPLDEEGTKWMTKKQLREGALEPSRNWIDAGSGSDRIFLEIIGCDGLPNLVREIFLYYLCSMIDTFVLKVHIIIQFIFAYRTQLSNSETRRILL